MFFLNFLLFILIPLGAVGGLYFNSFYIKYGLELFDEKDIKYKEQINGTGHKLITVGRSNIMSVIKKRKPVLLYIRYFCFITYLLSLIVIIVIKSNSV
jgi:hypothetical protein